MSLRKNALLGIAMGIALVAAPTLRGADKSLDEELTESLDSELLEGLETIPDDRAFDTGDEKSDSGIAAGDEDAFTRVSKRMRQAERLIPEQQAAKSTKELQKQIVTDLDQLIAELEKQCQKCQGGASSGTNSQQTAERQSVKQPSQKPSDGRQDAKSPAKESTQQLGKDEARKAALERMKNLLQKDEVWGELPAKAREQLLQLSPEQFLPKYELLIEKYYKRLAEQQEK